MDTLSLDEQVDALEAGVAYAELDDATIALVSGADARSWLNDLVTTDVASLEPGRTRPSLLLSPTGRIRAAFHVLCLRERDLALVQRTPAPMSIEAALSPYVLSSDVVLGPSRLRVFAIPGAAAAPAVAPATANGGHATAFEPSVLGGGFDLLVGASDDAAIEDLRKRLAAGGFTRVDVAALERRRIRRGQLRFAVDIDTDSLPAEAGLDVAPVTDRGKGCFLGQEAVAKIANLGHPTRQVLRIAAQGPLLSGDAVLDPSGEVGLVTSADGSVGIARVAWRARAGPLRTQRGEDLLVADPLAEPV